MKFIGSLIQKVFISTFVYFLWAVAAHAQSASKASLTSPVPGSTLSATSVSFQWTSGTGVSAYWLEVGTGGVGSKNLYNSSQGAATSRTVSGLPTSGTINVRLYSKIGDDWQWSDYTFTGGAALPSKASLTSPVPGSTLSATSVSFQWTSGTGVSAYWLEVGTGGVGSKNLYNSSQGAATSRTVSGLPTSGTINVRLYSKIGDDWQWSDYTFTVSAAPYTLTIALKAEAPSIGAVLSFTNPNTGGNVANLKSPTLVKLPRVFVRLRTTAGELVAERYSDDDGRVSFSGLTPTTSYRLGVASAAFTSDGLSVWVVNNRIPLDTGAQSFRSRYGVYWVYQEIPATPNFAGSTVERDLVLQLGYNASTRALDDANRSSGPFLLLNYIVKHQAFLAAAGAPAATLPNLTILWSPTNRASGDEDTYKFDEGIAGSSGAFFSSSTGAIDSTGKKSLACPCTSQNYIYLSGSQATEPMELTTAVPVHEFTHFTQRSTMRNASPGGPHSSDGEWQDFTLVQDEGFATGLALLVGGTSIEGRTFRFSSASDRDRFDSGFFVFGTDYRIRSGSKPEGWFQEGSFTSLIWRLFDPQGSTRLSASRVIAPFYSSTWVQGVWAPSAWAYGAILKDQNPTVSGAIDSLAASLNITLAGNDHWASTERALGNRTSSQTFPIYTLVPASGSVEVCSVGEKAEYNKLSNRRYLRFEGSVAPRTIRITGAVGTVPRLYIDRPGGYVFQKGSNTAEARATIPATGSYGWVGECAVVVSPSLAEADRTCSAQPYSPPAQTCWTITTSN
jgi:hypothetical protein